MPYISRSRRAELFTGAGTRWAGELNYKLTNLCLEHMAGRPESYGHYNEVIGALECCKLEMYRRAVAPYEDKKMEENGDVYPNPTQPS